MRTLAAVLTTCTLLAACGEGSTPGTPHRADVDAGKSLVESHCTGCHTLDGSGRTGEIPNLAGQPKDYLYEAMAAYRDGRRQHSALQQTITGFSESEIRDIAAYFSSLPPVSPTESETLSARYERGAEIAVACTGCHGERGVSSEAGIPSLAGQQPVYLMLATQEYANGGRGHEGKEEMLAGLQEVDIELMAMYFAAQEVEPREPPPFGDIQAGEALTARCGGCHGARGVSRDPMVPILAGQEPVYLSNAIRAYRNNERGHGGMVIDRNDAEIQSIAAWYAVQDIRLVAGPGEGVEEAAAKCNRCHGQGKDGQQEGVPRLEGQNYDYLVRTMRLYRDEQRENSLMHKMSAGFSDQLIEDIAAYYSTIAN